MNLPKPFLGRALIEVINENTEQYLKKKMGMENSIIALPEMTTSKEVPIKKGVVLETAPDWYGEAFELKNGSDVGYKPQKGDIVWFVPNETFACDPERKYHLLNDCDVVGYEKVEVKIEDKENVG